MKHPSGPQLPGHPKCGPGKIFSHKLGHCISVMTALKETQEKLTDLRKIKTA